MELLKLFIRLFPAIKDAFIGGYNFSFYLRKNKAIFMLVLTMIVLFVSFLYMSEQAVLHGTHSKILEKEVIELNQKQFDGEEQKKRY